jgi:hypothetical protein
MTEERRKKEEEGRKKKEDRRKKREERRKKRLALARIVNYDRKLHYKMKRNLLSQ